MDAEVQRPTSNDDQEIWEEYWKAQGMSWRTEPEIDEERQQYLAERRAVKPDIGNGIYPFRDENGAIRLTRADVEWLLATHESGGMQGPVDWEREKYKPANQLREGVDLRGAELTASNLSRLPLAGMRGGLSFDDLASIRSREREDAGLRAGIFSSGADLAGANLSGAVLTWALLDRCNLRDAVLQRAILQAAILNSAHLEGTDLSGAVLAGASLVNAFLSESTDLSFAIASKADVGMTPYEFFHSGVKSAIFTIIYVVLRLFPRLRPYQQWEDGPVLVRVHWGGADLTSVSWRDVGRLGDEWEALTGTSDGHKKSRDDRVNAFEFSALAYEHLATVLRSQGAIDVADRFAYRGRLCRRQLYRREWHWLRYLGSLFLDVISGYGYKPLRSAVTYLLVILSFAAAYFALTNFALTPFLPSHSSPLAWYEAIVLSISSFHGRGLFPSGLSLGDPLAILAAFEAIIGLLIEITFIATFTQRFFAH